LREVFFMKFTLSLVAVVGLVTLPAFAQETPCSDKNSCRDVSVYFLAGPSEANLGGGLKLQQKPALGFSAQAEVSKQASSLSLENRFKLIGAGKPGRDYWALGVRKGKSPIDKSTAVEARIGTVSNVFASSIGFEVGKSTNEVDERFSGNFIGLNIEGSRWLSDNIQVLGGLRGDAIAKKEIKDPTLARRHPGWTYDDRPAMDQNFFTFTGEMRFKVPGSRLRFNAAAVHQNKDSKLMYFKGDPEKFVHSSTLLKAGAIIGF
jgi:hypothetical protein